MKNLKKFLTVTIFAALISALTACGNDTGSNGQSEAKQSITTATIYP